MPDATTTYRRGGGVIGRRVAGELVLVPVHARNPQPKHREAELYVLNDSGAYLWEQLASAREPAELARNLTTTFDVDESQARADVRQFLEQMLAIGAVECEEGG